jgi:arylsulfatase A-like enzyme
MPAAPAASANGSGADPTARSRPLAEAARVGKHPTTMRTLNPAAHGRRAPARHAVLALAALVAAGCARDASPPGDYRAVVHRFIDAKLQSDGRPPQGLGRATLLDDTRSVLRAPRHDVVVWGISPEDPTGGRSFPYRATVPFPFNDAESLLVTQRMRVGEKWHVLPPKVLPTQRTPYATTVDLEYPLPPNPERERVVLTAVAFAIGLEDLERIETAEVEIPPDAKLEFALGVLEAEWGYDPVAFRIEACEGERCAALFHEEVDPADASARGWREREVDLRGLAGSRRRFRFLAQRTSRRAPFSFPLWANPQILAPAERPEDALSVIVLSIDTLRADHLTSYGYVHDTAPFIDARFRANGTVVDRTVAAANITTPAHASMFTSLSPVAHGTTDGLKWMPHDVPTLAERIRAAGIETAAVTEDGWLGIGNGFDRGFDRFQENKSPDIMEPVGQVDATFERARRWLESNADRRFFLFLHTFQVHTPYAPPERYRQLFLEHDGGRIDESSPSHLRWRAQYDQEIRYVDDELRRLFETIDALGLARDTVFILTSDHGEAFLEHGVLEHGARLDEEAVHVPLMFWGKGILAGVRVAGPAAHVDLLPTVLDLLKLPRPRDVEGVSLLPLLRGEDGGSGLARRPVFSESRGDTVLYAERSLIPFEPPAFAVRVGPRKLVRYREGEGFRYEYYDLASDPLEQKDLYASRADEAAELRRLLDGYEASGRALRERIGRGEAPAPARVLLDPEQEEKLRALGYLE